MDKSKVGPFALEERLGPNRSGKVFRAVHVQQRKSVALRFLAAPFLHRNAPARDAWSREFTELKQLRHPNIVRCLGGGFEPMHVYLASELIHGESLRELLDRRQRLPWETVVEYALQLCDALEAAHQQGLVHGELAPDKILIDENDQLKICDFRFDRQLDGDNRPPGERPLEKIAYLAPEQFAGSEAAGAKSDLYAVGCLLFEMLTGQKAFDAATADALIQLHQQQVPTRASSIVLECPVWLDVLIGQLLEKDPLRRPHAAATVVLALRETKRKVADGMGVLEHSVSGLSPLQPAVDKQEARRLLGRDPDPLATTSSSSRRGSRGSSGKSSRKAPRRRVGSSQPTPVYERPWFLAGCLLILLTGLGFWLWWPPNPESMLRRADKLMQSDDRYEWAKARRWYLEPLMKRFPDSPYVERARRHIDKLEMDAAERRMRFHARLGREAESEGERLYAEALQYEQFGDPPTAGEKYASLIQLLDEEGPDRPFVHLARRQLERLQQATPATEDRLALVASRLEEADRLVAEGERLEARKIWQSIAQLYGNKPEMSDQVRRAEQGLAAGLTESPEP